MSWTERELRRKAAEWTHEADMHRREAEWLSKEAGEMLDAANEADAKAEAIRGVLDDPEALQRMLAELRAEP